MTRKCYPRATARPGGSSRDLQMMFGRCRAGDAHAREAIILRFLPYAHRLAARYAGRGESVEDLDQVASIGLITAVDRYQPELGKSFLRYATPTIIGAIRHHFRDATWRVDVPRALKERVLRVKLAQDELRASRGVEPSAEAIATHLALELAEVTEAQRARAAYWHASLDATHAGEAAESLPLAETIGESDSQFERVETSVACGRALRRLDPRERKVLLLRFGCALTQSEIARQVGVCQVQVSRDLRNAISAMAADPELQ